jgi:hypothetical protein
MFRDYLSDFNYNLLKDTYNEEYLYSINKNTFLKNYHLLRSYNITCLEDIILNYLELFTYDTNILEERLKKLITSLGPNYNELINNNLSLLNELIKED